MLNIFSRFIQYLLPASLLLSFSTLANQGYVYKMNGYSSTDIASLCQHPVDLNPSYYLGVAKIYSVPGAGGGGYCDIWFNVVHGPGKERKYFSVALQNCASDEMVDPTSKSCVKKNTPRCTVGNPVDPLNGEKLQQETDLLVKRINNFPINISRFYKSNFSTIKYDYLPNTPITYNSGWNFMYTDKLSFTNYTVNSINIENVVFHNAEGFPVNFFKQNGLWISSQVEQNHITLTDEIENGVPVKKITTATTIKTFDSNGNLIKYKYIGGPELTFNYIDSHNNVYSVNWDTINVKYSNIPLFTYKVQRRVTTNGFFRSSTYVVKEVYINSSRKMEYTYNNVDNLIGARKYPNNEYTQYHYESLYDSKLLTGVTDSKGIRYASWIYDSNRRVVSSYHANNADRVDLTYYTNKVKITNSLNKSTVYHFANINNAVRVTQVEGEASNNCLAANKYITYTTDGLVQSKTDWKGIVTNYTYNSKGQEISRTEAAGTSEERIILTEWHPTLYKITKVSTPIREELFTYDSAGLLLSKSIQSIDE